MLQQPAKPNRNDCKYCRPIRPVTRVMSPTSSIFSDPSKYKDSLDSLVRFLIAKTTNFIALLVSLQHSPKNTLIVHRDPSFFSAVNKCSIPTSVISLQSENSMSTLVRDSSPHILIINQGINPDIYN